ncbi:hypothetical protein TNCV_1172041 [Trichonephila clavipes]|uniref:Uncharacterized protein n=1 Tax=Trichonephila clavipes TaxID=2585209 RepID=A0A8X6V8H7_TRICX|nr:hypothetical protein TNCV_1172041 [Trichonephila clavipes]
MSSPGFKPSPYSTTVTVANHYTGWAKYFACSMFDHSEYRISIHTNINAIFAKRSWDRGSYFLSPRITQFPAHGQVSNPAVELLAKIVEVEIGGVAIYRPFGELRRANSYCHLYGAQGLGQRQAYFYPLATMNLVSLVLTRSDR